MFQLQRTHKICRFFVVVEVVVVPFLEHLIICFLTCKCYERIFIFLIIKKCCSNMGYVTVKEKVFCLECDYSFGFFFLSAFCLLSLNHVCYICILNSKKGEWMIYISVENINQLQFKCLTWSFWYCKKKKNYCLTINVFVAFQMKRKKKHCWHYDSFNEYGSSILVR